MAGKLEGKIALVTGGSSGIGLATAQRFAKEGAFVFITGRREAELEKAVASIGVDKAKAIRADASNLADLDRLYEEIKKDKGRLDVLFVNAGGGSFAPLGSITEEHYDQTFNTNVKGVLFTVQKALPLIPNGGAIVLNASQVSIKGECGIQRLLRDQSGSAFLRSRMDDGFEGSPDPCECREPRPNRYSGTQRSC